MPDADKANRQIIGDKLKAYEHGEMEERLESRNRAIGQLGDMFDREIAGTEDGTDFDLANPGGKEEKAQPATPQTIQSSAAAYRDLNATLGNFYEQPKNDNAEMDELLERIASLESELESEKGRTSSMDEQVALMEKSYELAAKYMGGQNGGKPEQAAEPSTVQKGKKNTATPVRQVTRQVVSSLAQPMSNAEFVATFSQERNRGFNTAVGTTEVSDRNTIPACVHGAQSVTDGQTVRLRLLEPMAVAGRTIPRNAVVVGTGKIQGERLDIEVTSLEYDGTIIPVELAVYDTDGKPGIFIPNSMEMNAVREVAANMGGSLGSSINTVSYTHLDVYKRQCWCKAIKVLPDYSVVHKQDWFIKERYKPELQKDDMSFLSRSFERHFNERPYLKHTCYLYLTKTTKERNRMQSNFSTLCRGHIIPKELDRETTTKFLEACEQFERIMNDSGLVRLRRLSTDEIVGTEGKTGLIERYFSLMPEGDTTLQDIELSAREMRIGDNRLCLHTLSDAEDLPGKVATDTRYEKLSTDRSDCRLSFASPVGLLLSCNHIYNQYVLIDNSEETLQKFEKSARNMQSLSRYSRSNSINREWIDQYLNEAHSYGLTSVRAHFNVMAWSDDAEELKHIKNDVGSQLASMECVPRHNTIDCPTLYWAAIPGNAADFPAEESFHTFIEQAVCLFTEETNYRSSLSPFGIKMVDRLTGKPLHLDISDLPMKRGITTNRNKFVLGPSGSGKSFFMNHLVRQYYEQGAHVVLVLSLIHI